VVALLAHLRYNRGDYEGDNPADTEQTGENDA
jgi:hypothetical protein